MNELRKYLIPGLLLCGLFAGCTSQTDPSEQSGEKNSDDKKPKIALIMKSLANDFFSSMAKGAESHQQAHSDDYDLVVNGIKDERDLSRQVALVEEMVSSGVDAIVIAPADSKALVPALRPRRAKRVWWSSILITNWMQRYCKRNRFRFLLSVPIIKREQKKSVIIWQRS